MTPHRMTPHRMRPHRLLAALLFASLVAALATPVAAQTTNYRVELVLFTHRDAASQPVAHWPAREPLPGTANAIDLANPAAGFRALGTDAFTLRDAAERMRRSGRYDIVGHYVWEQPGLGEKAAQPVRIVGGKLAGQDVAQVEGAVTLILGRYLHIRSDLLLRMPALTGEHHWNEVRVQERRRMRSRELHYLDHPLLGMLVQITPVDGS